HKRGRMEQVQAAHMELLHRWLKVRVDARGNTPSTQRLRDREAELDAELRTLARELRRLPNPGTPGGSARITAAQRAELARLNGLVRDRREERAAVRKQRRGFSRETNSLAIRMHRLREKRARGWQLTMSEQTMLSAWDNPEPLPAAVLNFFD